MDVVRLTATASMRVFVNPTFMDPAFLGPSMVDLAFLGIKGYLLLDWCEGGFLISFFSRPRLFAFKVF